MNMSSSPAPRRNPANRTIKVSQTARAIRAALAVSATMLALAGSGVVMAGTCTPLVPVSGNTVNCDGVFITSINYAVDDLTVIIGGVDPATTVTTAGVDGVHQSGAFGQETLINYGSITTNATAAGVNAVQVYSAIADASLTNGGDIYAYGSAGFNVTSALVYTAIGDVLVDNQLGGTITAYADAAGGSATGLNAHTAIGNTTVSNEGDITATAIANGGKATGINAYSAIGDVSLTSDGTVVATSSGDAASAFGIFAHTGIGYVDVSNGGTVSATASGLGSDAFGINAYTNTGDVTVSNDGSITSTVSGAGTGEAWGIYANITGASGNVSVYNSATGSIAASVNDGGGDVWAITAYNHGAGTVTVGNDGILTATTVNGFGDAYGITAEAYGDGAVDVSNSATGVIGAYAGGAAGVGGPAYGIFAVAKGLGDVTVGNDGAITATSLYGEAHGVYAYSFLGNAAIINSATGSITATGYNSSYGIYAYASGSVTVGNDGAISASSMYGYASGVHAYSDLGDVAVTNTATGSITATGYTGADGIYAYAAGDGNITVNNAGVITVSASGDNTVLLSYSNAYGISVETASAGLGDIVVDNSGTVTVSANDNAYGVYANAFGSGAVTATNSGSFDVSSAAADATGIYVWSASNYAGDLTVTNTATGAITATADAGSAYGISARTSGDGNVNINNSGTIDATAAGGSAYGIDTRAGSALVDNIKVYNYGTISATSDGFAVGVQMDSDSSTYIYNAGTISASGLDASTSYAINSIGLSNDYIHNYGTINGAIATYDGDDFLLNEDGGVWNASGNSFFGAGDDEIFNAVGGTIHMTDALISMGSYVGGNKFYNYGTIKVSGALNEIDMDNPFPVFNYGTIDFQDGAANDYLLIVGDFAGQGDINVDVSGLAGTSDVLYIDGNVIDGIAATVQTINVDLLDLPDTISSDIPIVYVSGDSVASNFALGTVNFDGTNSFVTLDFSLIADIDASNATPDTFSLGIDVTGLSDPGTLAASIAPGVQSLINSEVGTWRQRMGVIDSFSKGAVSLWARVFTDKGSFSPEHVATNFGQGGNFDFEQKNSGFEAGVDFSVTDEFNLGLLVGKSKASQHLDGPGVGSTDISADIYGLYGTWISPTGFYLDTSYRWVSFDADLSSVAGPMRASGDAKVFNVEGGFAWTLDGGLKIEPQAQYTSTNVDKVDLLTTSTGMHFQSEGGDSSRGRLGVSFRKSFVDEDNGWVWTPYATISAVREFDGKNSYAINNGSTNLFTGRTSIEGTSALLELGFTARQDNWAVYGGLNWQDGGALNSFVGGQLGVRYTFGGAAPAPEVVVAPPAPAKTCADLDDDGDGVNNCDDKCPGSTTGQAVGPDGCPVPAPEPEPVMEPKPFRG